MSWDVMFCHADRRDPLRYVMQCHDRHAAGAYPVACSVIGPCLYSSAACSFLPLSRLRALAQPSPGGRGLFGRRFRSLPGSGRGAFPGSVFAFLHVVPPSRFVPLRSIRPAAGLPGSGTLIRAYPARACAGAGGRVYRGGAVRAPDCARENAGRTSPVCFPAIFSRRRRRETGSESAPRGCRLLPPCHCNTIRQMSSIIARIISEMFGTGFDIRSCGIRRRGPP